jgi:hypothetical protein
MALSLYGIANASATVTNAGTSVAPSTVLPDNCHTVLVLNTHATANIFVTAVTAALGVGSALNTTNSTLISAGSSVTLGVGHLGQRPGSLRLQYDASVNGAVANITYVCGTDFSDND